MKQIFLAHASQDKELVKQLYRLLVKHGFKPWLDEYDLLPGQQWEKEIKNVIRQCDFFIACLSRTSVQKQGFVQKEFRFGLTIYAEKPPGTIFFIPVRFDDCQIPDLELPEFGISFRGIHWLDIRRKGGFKKLIDVLQANSNTIYNFSLECFYSFEICYYLLKLCSGMQLGRTFWEYDIVRMAKKIGLKLVADEISCENFNSSVIEKMVPFLKDKNDKLLYYFMLTSNLLALLQKISQNRKIEEDEYKNIIGFVPYIDLSEGLQDEFILLGSNIIKGVCGFNDLFSLLTKLRNYLLDKAIKYEIQPSWDMQVLLPTSKVICRDITSAVNLGTHNPYHTLEFIFKGYDKFRKPNLGKNKIYVCRVCIEDICYTANKGIFFKSHDFDLGNTIWNDMSKFIQQLLNNVGYPEALNQKMKLAYYMDGKLYFEYCSKKENGKLSNIY